MEGRLRELRARGIVLRTLRIPSITLFDILMKVARLVYSMLDPFKEGWNNPYAQVSLEKSTCNGYVR